MTAIRLPAADGTLGSLEFGPSADLPVRSGPASSRLVYAAAHVVADPLRASASAGPDQIDWDTTLRLRHRLWDLGLGVAEAMDTSQRGMGLNWHGARELARRSLAEARSRSARMVVGIATDQLPAGTGDLTAVREAYLEQLHEIEDMGGEVVLMASRQLVRAAGGAEDYLSVYDAVLGEATRPVVLHWLGEVFDPALAGYWGHTDTAEAMEVVLDVIGRHTGSVRGIKVSLLDADLERELRRRLPDGVRLFTGDDYNYTDLIAGDGTHHSDALLGAFAVVGRHASAALSRLDEGDEAGFRDVLGPTETLSRLVFAPPTRFYKVGVAWLSYLDGAQDHFRMIDGFETGRSLGHLGDLVRAADSVGLFTDPDLTAHRAAGYFASHGIG
ncbi:dihydrodipicolinate synthase family protein [Nocardiopsis dassonvillei]|uniref:dihydrodipicolinate synthase family protein n=1 Tax=Nocardiopsis dassonvillei TaxID=2014 RepID=UPI0033FD128B